jgi:hypothetical protein
MDKKKTLIQRVWILCIALATLLPTAGQNIRQIKFCDKSYEYGAGHDSLTLFFNLIDGDGNRVRNVSPDALSNYLVVREGESLITSRSSKIEPIVGGQRIPTEYTFSVLIDLSIPNHGKSQIYQALSQLVNSALDGSVYLSFFGNDVTSSKCVTKENLKDFESFFSQQSKNKYLYGSLYAKLLEFSTESNELENDIKESSDYKRNSEIAQRALLNKDKNILFVFTEGNKNPTFEESIGFMEVNDYQQNISHIVPTVYAFYYTEEGNNAEIENILMALCNPHIEARKGDYKPANDMNQVLIDFQEVVNDRMYDFAFIYQVNSSKVFSGATQFVAEWKGDIIGEGTFSIGSAERPWPERDISTTDSVYKFIIAFLIALFAIVFFIAIMKIVIPFIRSKRFESKYYIKYIPEPNVSVRICHYCRQPIEEGDLIVNRCMHTTHIHCWKENGYKCAEYGQNCKDGIQECIDWKELITRRTFRECQQMIAGIIAGFISWILFEIVGRGCFGDFSNDIVNACYSSIEGLPNLSVECTGKTSAFLTIGLLLGFFLSLIFRYNDEYRKQNMKVVFKILGLSLLTGLIGLFAFGLGAVILCLLLSAMSTSYIPWYCSFPAYVLFSLGVSMALTIKSTIPLKSAILGGGCSAVIGFVVLYLSSLTSNTWPWMSMLLDFIIYGGGLGASLITVRMLAEHYFLIIENGIKAGTKIPIHKWMNSTGGGQIVKIGMTTGCEIQMNWEKSNKVAKEHVKLYIDHERQLPILKPLEKGVIYNARVALPIGRATILSNHDIFEVGDTIFQYIEE